MNRIRLELADRFVTDIRSVVVQAIAKSVEVGGPAKYDAAEHYVQATVEVDSPDEVYLLIGACGVYRPEIVAIMLDAVPGVGADAWIAEPDPDGFGADVKAGEVVYSTVINSAILQEVIALAHSLS